MTNQDINFLELMELVKFLEVEMIKFDTDIQPPIDTVSIILCAYNEEPFIEQCVKSLRNQSILTEYPEYFEIIFCDNESTDKTVEIATPYVDKLLSAPRGKLNARNKATDNSNGNIIVSVDADAYYPAHWLNTLLKPFNDNRTAAVHGSVFDYTIPTMAGQFYTLIGTIVRLITFPTRMAGVNSAYWKHLFYLGGKFNENINQFDVNEMVEEEEINFGDRLSQYGNVVFKINASCIHFGGFKFACRQGEGDPELCEKYGFGIERFDVCKCLKCLKYSMRDEIVRRVLDNLKNAATNR